LKRFTASLLFTYGIRGHLRKRMICESRLIVLSARSVPGALAVARRYGKRECRSYFNPDGELFELKFIGVADLVDLTYLDRNEVWYQIFESKNHAAD
jgi:hypothetical protein